MWRHGRTEWNATGRFQGQLDVPLDPTGREQAVRAAAALALLRPAAVVSSDLARARDTAQALGDACGLPVGLDRRLRETYAGSWQGLDHAELTGRHGDELARWAAGEDLRPGGGETRTEVADRVVAAVDDALAGVPDGRVLVVATHGAAARVAIGRLLGLPPELWSALGVLANCAWSVLTEAPAHAAAGRPWRLAEYNAGSLPVPALADDR